MTKDFEVIKEQPLHLDDQGIEIPVSVGWGKKETQFHGSVGKQAAKEKVNISDFTVSKDEDHLPKVSWRGDGSYLVISIINPLTGIRQLKVFSREGDLINVSEPVDKLEHLVNWRPSGNLITCSQRSPPNRHEIIFFERNGLRHGEFTLPKNVEKLIQIGWNCDSTILGLLLIYNNPNGLQDYRLQLWTMGNYHYYLKQEIIIGIVGSGQVNEIEFVWDTERFNGLNIAYLGNIHSILLHLEALTSSVLTPIEPMGLVSVVDGSQLLITPYKYKNVPPPMSAYQIPTQSQIQHVSYSTFNHGNDILVLLNDSKVGLITFDGPKSTPALGSKFLDLNSLDLPQINYRQITYPKKDEIYLLGYSEDAMSDIVVRVQIECSDDKWNDEVKIISQTFNTIDSSIIKLNHFENLPYPLIQDNFGDFYQVIYEENEIKFTQGIDQLPAFKFPEACSRYSVFKGNDSDDEIYFVGLSSRNKLYINDQLVESGCTSFTMHNEFLLFTTSDHLVKFIYWKGLYENQFNIQNYVNLLEPYHRKLERGSKLVVTTPGDVNVVIQMPRGNLETVYPRALVVANVLNHVTDLRYDLAFIQCRKHRIDHNIIYDFNPQQLLDNIPLFVEQVKDSDYLNLFLSSMTNKNVLKELYPPMMPKSLEDGDKLTELFATKRDLLCIGVRDVLRTKPGKEYYPTVMTTYVRQVPPNLEDALELLKSIKGKLSNIIFMI
jgi:elongator complex protein 1